MSVSGAGSPEGRERRLTVNWCPRCQIQTERMHHLCEKGPPLIPQMDEYTTCTQIEVVPASELEAAEAEREQLREQRDGMIWAAERLQNQGERAESLLRAAVEALDNLHAGLTLASIREILEQEFAACAANLGEPEPCAGCRAIAEFIALDQNEVRALALAPDNTETPDA